MIVDPEAAREARQREAVPEEEPAKPIPPAVPPPAPHANRIPWRERDLTKDRGW